MAHKFLESLQLAAKDRKLQSHEEGDLADLMGDPNYLRQSSALINEALQKGFDVLQLANGDIVTTGTKTIVHQYSWDNDKARLTKTKVSERKARKTEAEKLLETLDEDI